MIPLTELPSRAAGIVVHQNCLLVMYRKKYNKTFKKGNRKRKSKGNRKSLKKRKSLKRHKLLKK